MRRRVAGVHIAGLPAGLASARPLVLVADHVSWWDGFVLREVQRRLRPAAPLYTVMSRAELRRYPFLRWLGAVGLEPGSPASARALLRSLLAARRRRPDLVVACFPQGAIWPSFRRPLGFRRGVETLVRALAPAVALPIGIHVEPLASPAPRIFVAAGEPAGEAPDRRLLERRIATELDRILAFLATHGEDSPEAWPAPGARLPAGPAPPAPRRARSR